MTTPPPKPTFKGLNYALQDVRKRWPTYKRVGTSPAQSIPVAPPLADPVKLANHVATARPNLSDTYLMKQLAILVTSSLLCDHTVSDSDGSHIYKIHRLVLSAQSPTFRALLLDQIGGGGGPVPNTNTVSGVSPAVLEQVLSYMYTGTFDFSDGNVEDALAVAQQLDLPRLKDRGVAYLHNYNFANIFVLIDIAFKYDLQPLLTDMLRYAQLNFVALVESQQEKFNNISGDVLLGILSQSSESRNEKELLRRMIQWINVNRSNRSPLALGLLQAIDFTKLNPTEIEEYERMLQEILNTDECIDVIQQAYKYHALRS